MPAIYQFFAGQYGWTPDQVDRLTMYQACIFMGAITPDHGRMKMSLQDYCRYYGNRQRGK